MSRDESRTTLTPEEMQEQLRAYAERNTGTYAARSVRYDLGIQNPEKNETSSGTPAVPLDLSKPSAPADWQCTGCGARLDGSLLKIHASRLAFNDQQLATCPHCGGAAQNLQQVSNRLAEEREKELIKQKTNLRNSIICSVGLVLFLFSPSIFTFLLCWVIAFWFGPLRETHLKMKLGAIFVIFWGGFIGTFAISQLGEDYFGKLLLWLLITLVMVAAGWMIERVSSLGGGLFYKG